MQKKQAKPIKLKGVKPKTMLHKEWTNLDKLVRSTIMLTLEKSVFYNVKETRTSYELWEKLCGLYKQKSAASLVYSIKYLVDLKMKEGTPMSNHLNDFKSIYDNLVAQDMEFSKLLKAWFLLIILQDNWDTFCTIVMNFAPATRGLTEENVASSLLTEEVNRKKNENTCGGNGLYVKGRFTDKGKSQDRA